MRKRDHLRTLLGITARPTIVPPPAAVSQVQTPSTIPSTNNSPTRDPKSSKQVTHNSALELAISRQLESLKADEKEAFRNASKNLTDGNILFEVKKWDDAHKAESYFRPKAESISRFLGLLDRFMAGVTIGIQANPDISAIVVGGVRVVIDQAVKFVGFFDKLSDMLCRLSDFLGALHEYDKSSAQNTIMVEVLANVYGDLLKFCKHAHAVFTYQGVRKKMTSWRTFWHMQWMPFEEEFSKIESSMQHHIQVLQNAAQAITLNTTLNRDDRDRVAQREAFLNWISSIPFETIHDDIHAKKHPQTGEWLIQTKQFQDWFHSPSSTLLWCYGTPGAGKSVLASNVLEHISSHHSPHQEVGICFSYYNYQSPEMANLSQIIPALIKQLCRKRKVMPLAFLIAKQNSDPPSKLGNQSSFLTIAQDFTEVFLLIDGLDECPEDKRPNVLGFLKFLVENLPYFKIFVTSRREKDLVRAFEELKAPKIEIEAKSVAADITKYVADEVKQLRQGYDGKKLYVKSITLEQKIIDTLTTKADGMFLWTSLQIANLCRVSESQKDSELEKELDTLPLGLDATYTRAMDQIEKQPSNLRMLAYKCFMWVMHATRELNVMELQHALATDTEKLDNNTKEMELYPVDTILGACANLLVKRGSYLYEGRNTIRPVHFSVQEFIRNPPAGVLETLSLRRLNDVPYINAQLASICLSYLQSYVLEGPCSSDHQLNNRIDKIPFAWYASCTFDYHIKRCGNLPDELHRGVLAFLGREQWFLSAILQLRMVGSFSGFSHVASTYQDFTQPYLKVDGNTLVYETDLYNLPSLRNQWGGLKPAPFALHRACFAGLGDVVSRLLLDGQQVNEADADGVCPIYYAAGRGHTHILTMLLDNGADVNVQGGYYGTALQVASYHGYEHIVHQLLNHRFNYSRCGRDQCAVDLENYSHHGSNGVGISFPDKVDVNANCGRYGTAIQAAAAEGHLNIVKLLLVNGAHVNLEGGCHGFALHAASVSGHKDIVEMLLDRCANINAKVGEYGFALHAASYFNHKDIVEMLLDRGANINAEGGHHGFALHAASKSGRKDIFEMLLDRGANINAEGGKHGFALHAASSGCHKDVIELLLSKGVDVHGCNDSGGTALHEAAAAERWREGSTESIELLLSRGANIHACDNGDETPLHKACLSGTSQRVKLLLSKGADIHARTDGGETPLHRASCSGQSEVMELLLSKGADIYARTNSGETPLHRAVEGWGCTREEVELLLSKGADIHARTDGGETPLHGASWSGQSEVVGLLLSKGADIYARTNGGETPLHRAVESWECTIKVVELLLSKGADIHARTTDGKTALQMASDNLSDPPLYWKRDDFAAVVELLLSKGAVYDEHPSGKCDLKAAGAEEADRGDTPDGLDEDEAWTDTSEEADGEEEAESGESNEAQITIGATAA